jgi:hypothetical protein
VAGASQAVMDAEERAATELQARGPIPRESPYFLCPASIGGIP